MKLSRMINWLSVIVCFYGAEKLLGRSPNRTNWHHEGLTRGATGQWSRPAENALAFHATYIDAYQYNPVWWLDVLHGGGTKRVRVGLSSRKRLSTLHFDDIYGAEQVSHTWQRYLSGTVCGLMWIASSDQPQREKISCAHNVIGASLHAIQDFYAHSNWIDIAPRRDKTWFEAGATQRTSGNLYTGYYERPGRPGAKPHGMFQIWCRRAKTNQPTRALFRVLGDRTGLICKGPKFPAGQDGIKYTSTRIPLAGKISVPRWLGCVGPGMNLDSRWQAVPGVKERGEELRPPLTAHAAFEGAYDLAQRSSLQWIRMLERAVCELGYPTFWRDITSIGVGDDHYRSDIQPFERTDMLPYLFLSAGPYPPLEADDENWYLRLLVETGDFRYAGACGDIVPCLDGQRFTALNHEIIESNKVLGLGLRRMGLGRGERSAHVVGPLKILPHEVSLIYGAGPSRGDRLGVFAPSNAGVRRWHCKSVEVVAFRRGRDAEVVRFSHNLRSQWVEPGSAVTFSLQETGSMQARVVACWAKDVQPD